MCLLAWLLGVLSSSISLGLHCSPLIANHESESRITNHKSQTTASQTREYSTAQYLFIHSSPSIYTSQLSLFFFTVHTYIHPHPHPPRSPTRHQPKVQTNTTNAALGPIIRLPLMPLPIPATPRPRTNPSRVS
jgi:hypothetical protein